MELRGEGFIIRPVQQTSQKEVNQVLEVYRQCEDFLALGPVPAASLAMVLADFDLSRDEGGVFCGIYDSATGEMAGIVDFVTAGFEGDPSLAFLSLLMIAEPYRCHGLGAKVVAAVEEAIRQDGRARAIRSGVQVNNPLAIHFWQRMGFRIISGPELLADGTTCFQLWKDLSCE